MAAFGFSKPETGLSSQTCFHVARSFLTHSEMLSAQLIFVDSFVYSRTWRPKKPFASLKLEVRLFAAYFNVSILVLPYIIRVVSYLACNLVNTAAYRTCASILSNPVQS